MRLGRVGRGESVVRVWRDSCEIMVRVWRECGESVAGFQITRAAAAGGWGVKRL